jgi:hypothetical protein
MREADEEERLELEQKQITSTPVAPVISNLNDEDLVAEMRRRAEVKQQ